jgi:uncharacterized protein (TIGR02391 family)
MIRWHYIAKKLADKYSRPQGLGHWNLEHLLRCWNSLFDFKPQDFGDKRTICGNYGVVYSFVMSIAEREELNDEEKAENILKLMKEIANRVDYEGAAAIFKEAGYVLNRSAEEPTQLSQHGNFHPEVVSHCKILFDQGHYFHAMSEACKAYNIAVKNKLGGTSKDGRDLMLSEFGQGKRIRAVPGDTESENNFLEGLKFLSAGLIQGFRNPTSHETVQTWKVDKQDCLDVLSLASYLFRQLDKASFIS